MSAWCLHGFLEQPAASRCQPPTHAIKQPPETQACASVAATGAVTSVLGCPPTPGDDLRHVGEPCCVLSDGGGITGARVRHNLQARQRRGRKQCRLDAASGRVQAAWLVQTHAGGSSRHNQPCCKQAGCQSWQRQGRYQACSARPARRRPAEAAKLHPATAGNTGGQSP